MDFTRATTPSLLIIFPEPVIVAPITLSTVAVATLAVVTREVVLLVNVITALLEMVQGDVELTTREEPLAMVTVEEEMVTAGPEKLTTGAWNVAVDPEKATVLSGAPVNA
jgi:hypothetical protein